ncbi:hypothetical protein GJA_2206 [Janthinobacterium agaricidamnosum NBRC 102515 = DSM 9628]|uniref:Uncharacterized protein n=2 Tax=Janthinobacterium agaricidamnosum TaxID=55508 RepID=W0V4N7_9BURK|nr:hypothetical protein GJA_2206 [Janthinobacterium agaricidamnosum NBRC 102515 = DSM 9628]
MPAGLKLGRAASQSSAANLAQSSDASDGVFNDGYALTLAVNGCFQPLIFFIRSPRRTAIR